MAKVENFELDHNLVKAPYVRVAEALGKTLQRILDTKEVPAVSQVSCGNYKDHSLFA